MWLIRWGEFCILKILETFALRKLVIAIDGPAASGKSTTARLTAERLHYLHIDTGAMYRAMTLKVLERQVNPSNHDRVAELARTTSIRLMQKGKRMQVLLDGRDVTDAIRDPAVTRAVSEVSSIPAVRELMVREQRLLGKSGAVVLDGRDIGTIVFPEADLKVFLVADVHERARRRQKEMQEQGYDARVEDLERELLARDTFDSSRDVSPLRRAVDALLIDTSNMTIDEQVSFIVEKARALMRSENNDTMKNESDN